MADKYQFYFSHQIQLTQNNLSDCANNQFILRSICQFRQSKQYKIEGMKGTIFQPLVKMYILRYPSNKSISKNAIPKIQNLAISFYTHIYDKILKTDFKGTWLQKYPLVKQSVREAYTNMFYMLGNTNQTALDFISCMICLISDTIFTHEHIQKNQNVEQFIQAISSQDQKLREYLYIAYIYETLGYRVGKESAVAIFNKFIVQENHYQLSLGAHYKINMQLKGFKENIQNNQAVNIKYRPKKKTKNTKNNKNLEYLEEIKSIFYENNIELQQQRKNEKIYEKFLNKCGNLEQEQKQQKFKYQKKDKRIPRLSQIFQNLKYCNKFDGQKNQNIKIIKLQDQNSAFHWKNVLKQIKAIPFLSRKDRVSALGYYSRDKIENYSNSKIQRYSHNQKGERSPGRNTKIPNKYSKCPILQKKSFCKYDRLLPQIRKFQQTFISNDDNNENLNEKKTNLNTKTLKKQLSEFIIQRKNIDLLELNK